MVTTLMIAGAALSLTAAPADLDARLIATTGCGSNEIERLLASGPDRVACALAPFLVEQLDHVELSNLIAADPAAIGLVRALYAVLPLVTAEPALVAADPTHTPEAE